MTTQPEKTIDTKVVIALILIAVALFAVLYYVTHREISDPQVLIAKTVDASEDIHTYRFALLTNLSMPEGDIEMMSGLGYVDYPNKKLRTTMTMMNQSIEMVVVNDTAYVREAFGSWQTQKLEEQGVWESQDQLKQQYSLLQNATNVTMKTDENGWVLDIIPDRKEVIEQMRRMGRETINEDELKNYTIRYQIEKEHYYITKIESQMELEMNIQGMVTPMQLQNFVTLDNYNEQIEIIAPLV
jgi:hypothetical protein